MIPRKNSIPTKQFPAVLKGPSLHGAYFRTVVSDTIPDNKPHIAIIIPKKHAKLATERNLFKRAINMEIVKQMDILPNKTFVFMMQKSIPYEKTIPGRKQVATELARDAQQIVIQIIKKYGKAT